MDELIETQIEAEEMLGKIYLTFKEIDSINLVDFIKNIFILKLELEMIKEVNPSEVESIINAL